MVGETWSQLHLRQKLDKTTITVLSLIAVAAVLLVIFMIYIVDRSGEQVTEIKNTKVLGPGANLASSLSSEDDLTILNIKGENSRHPSCTVSDGTIKEAMFHKIAQIKNLREVSLKRCEFNGADFQIIANCPLEAIHFDDGKINEDCLRVIGRMPLLRLLEMFACDVNPHSLAHLNNSNMQWLQLRYSQNSSGPSNFMPDQLAVLGEMKNLKYLELERSSFAPGAFRSLGKSNIVALNVERCNLTDDDIADLVKMPKLAYLNLTRNPRVTCKGLRLLLESKTILQVSFNEDISKCGFSKAEQNKLNPKLFIIPPPLWQKFSEE